jgi:hypothetical protein
MKKKIPPDENFFFFKVRKNWAKDRNNRNRVGKRPVFVVGTDLQARDLNQVDWVGRAVVDPFARKGPAADWMWHFCQACDDPFCRLLLLLLFFHQCYKTSDLCTGRQSRCNWPDALDGQSWLPDTTEVNPCRQQPTTCLFFVPPFYSQLNNF